MMDLFFFLRVSHLHAAVENLRHKNKGGSYVTISQRLKLKTGLIRGEGWKQKRVIAGGVSQNGTNCVIQSPFQSRKSYFAFTVLEILSLSVGLRGKLISHYLKKQSRGHHP